VLGDLQSDLGSYSKLEQAIKDSIAEQGSDPKLPGAPRAIDRRKLKAIVDDDPKLVLTIGELRALDLYLERFGDGLAFNPLFEKPELLRGLAESGRVDFLLGSKADKTDDFRINISHWDLLGLNQIQSGVLGFSQRVHVEIREVPMQKNIKHARGELHNPELVELFGDNGPSLVCLGSIRGNQMAEWMLCGMGGDLERFRDVQPKLPPHLPFHFVWAKDRGYVLESAFHRYGKDAAHEDPEVGQAVLKKKAAGFHHDDRYIIDELTHSDNDDGYTYALCAAQRRRRGQIWLLVAGLTGPATYAAAKWVRGMPAGLDDYKPGEASPVYWSLVRAKATRVQESTRLTYQVGEAEFVAGDVWG
jgi:hypothetical protein